MIQVGIHQAKTQLSKLISRLRLGEEVMITKSGEPVAKLSAWHQPNKKKRKLGIDADAFSQGKAFIDSNFDAEDESILEDFGL